MRNSVLAALMGVVPMIVCPQLAEAAGDLGKISILARRQSSLIDRIEPYVERVDQPKMRFLKQTCRRLFESMMSLGPANMETVQKLQESVIAFRFSRDTFKAVYTEKTAPWIEELQKTARELADQSGFDQSLYTKITLSAFRQMHELTVSLARLNLPGNLSDQLKALQPRIGLVLAAATTGDHRKTLEEGERCLREIVKLYPAFNEISISNEAFSSVMEIQGIGEFYADFIRVDDPLAPTSPMKE